MIFAKTVLAIMIALSFQGTPASASSCDVCRELKSVERAKRSALIENERVLKSTNEYIARRDRAPAHGVAARSNIVILQLRLETIQNELEYVQKAQEKNSCGSCGL